MRITKHGHCCLIIEEAGVRIMTDPGSYSTLQNDATGIDFVFITHEHQDHFHLESLTKVLKNNPKAKIVTNSAVGRLLDAEKISYEILGDGDEREFAGVHVAGHGTKHAEIYPSFKAADVLNTGYFFAKRFFYPGDAFHNPNASVEILALPVVGGWLKMSEAIDYARLIKPKVCFPVHDATLKTGGTSHAVPAKILPPLGIQFEVILEGEAREF